MPDPKEGGALLIAAAIAAIAIIGSILALLSLNGIELGALNSISIWLVKYAYMCFVVGTALLLIGISLIAALTRSYYDKQNSRRESSY